VKYLLLWPLANLRQHPWVSATAVASLAAVVFVVATLAGFVRGYEAAVARDVDRMGFDLLVTARGCPYEAATLMLRGGVGLRYMPDGVVARLDADPAVAATYPTLIHPVRDPDSPAGMALVKGVTPGFRQARRLELVDGAWLGEAEGVVLGFEAAELAQRRAGDTLVLPGLDTPLVVAGVLARTGSQLDGTVLMELAEAQSRFGLADRLTGVGVQVDPAHRGSLEALRDRYDNEAELQVIALDTVTAALRGAMDDLRGVVSLLTGVLGLLGAALMGNTTLLRALSEHRRHAVLRAAGFAPTWIAMAMLVETLLLLVPGVVSGLVVAALARGPTGSLLAGYLPYAPSGDLVTLSAPLLLLIGGAALALALLATAPAVLRMATGDVHRALQADG
jgi:putative ABC transport system permease protein